MSQPTLFDQYPHVAGHRGTDTGELTAAKVEPKAQQLRSRIFTLLAANEYKLTADEIANTLREDVLSIRPRVTELLSKGLLIDTGIRRASSRGNMQRVVSAI